MRETGASIPDLDKILKLSALFGVSTDYLLKDELDCPGTAGAAVPESGERTVSAEEADGYLADVCRFAAVLPFSLVLFILSPVLLILFGGLAEYTKLMTEQLGASLGVIALLVLVAAGLVPLIRAGMRMDQYEWLEKEPFTLQYGVRGVVEKRRADFEPTWFKCVPVGVCLCLLGVILLLAAAAVGADGMIAVAGVCALLVCVAAGAAVLAWGGTLWDSFAKLLQTGEYTPQKKARSKRFGGAAGVYWLVVTAVYLGISFTTDAWDRSWIVWPVAGVLFAALMGVLEMVAIRAEKK